MNVTRDSGNPTRFNWRKVCPVVSSIKIGLFRQGVLAASAALGSRDTYFCPICATGFQADALTNGTLSLEHVPPKSVGGRAIILTCKACNNTAGHSIDAEVANKEKQQQLAETLVGKRRGYGGRALMEVGGAKVNIELHNQGDVVALKIIQANDPQAVARVNEYMKKLSEDDRWKGEKFNITAAKGYHYRLSKVSDLRTAFLVCTATFGYTFAFDKSLERVREQIMKPNETVLTRWWLTVNGPPTDRQIAIVEREGVILVSQGSDAVVLPYPPRGVKAYDDFCADSADYKKLNVKAHFFCWPVSFVAAIDQRKNHRAEAVGN